MTKKIFEGLETFVIGNDSVKRCYIHGENKFVLVEETKVTKNFKCVLAVLNVRRSSFDDRCHNFVLIAGNKFDGTTAGRNDGSIWVVRFVDFR